MRETKPKSQPQKLARKITKRNVSKEKKDDKKGDRPLKVTNAQSISCRTTRSQSQTKVNENKNVRETVHTKLVLSPRTTGNRTIVDVTMKDIDIDANKNRSVELISERVSIAASKKKNVKRHRKMIDDNDSATNSPSPTNQAKRRRIMIVESDSTDTSPATTPKQTKLRRGTVKSGTHEFGRKNIRRTVPETDSTESTPKTKSNPKKRKRNPSRKRNKKSKSVPDVEPDELTEELPKKKRSRQSTVWEHFDEVWKTIEHVETKYVQCKYCST